MGDSLTVWVIGSAVVSCLWWRQCDADLAGASTLCSDTVAQDVLTADMNSRVVLLLVLIICGLADKVAVGLPIGLRQERSYSPDIIAGDDFLNIFMGAAEGPSYVRQPRTMPLNRTTENTRTTLSEEIQTKLREEMDQKSNTVTATSSSTTTEALRSFYQPNNPTKERFAKFISRRMNDKMKLDRANKSGPSQKSRKVRHETTSSYNDQEKEAPMSNLEALISIQDSHIVSKSGKDELNVDEGEPITRETRVPEPFIPRYSQNLQGLSQKEDLPYHHTLIYHNPSRDSSRARSVSYSTVIQALPRPQDNKPWKDQDNSDRRYHQVPSYATSTTRSVSSSEEVKRVVLKPTEAKRAPEWSKPTTFRPEVYTERQWGLPEKNYGLPEQSYGPKPVVYGKPEENYEIDETISVQTNGRAHGVQKTPDQKKPTKNDGDDGDDTQVGYVVEGRDYKKYRVEERTPDGFIVGEYGVVSNDGGNLRGVRYTADGTINPRLIYDALMKFLSL